MSSNKRSSAYKHGQPGQEYIEEREEITEPKRNATAAQLATRKIKTARGSRRPAGATSGLSAFNPNPPSASSFNFGPDPNAGAAAPNPFAQSAPPQQNAFGQNAFGQSQQQDTSAGSPFAFGSNSTSSFPPAQPTGNNPFAASTTSSFPPPSGFGGNSNTNNTNNSTPSFNFGASAPSTGFVFGGGAQSAPIFGGASQSNVSTQGTNNATPAFAFNAATQSQTPSTPAFGSFGQQSQPPAFGASTQGQGASTPAFAFGQQSQQPALGTSTQGQSASTPAFSFGQQSQQPALGTSTQGQAASTPAFAFGTPTKDANKSTPSFPGFGTTTQGATTPVPKFSGFGVTTQGQTAATPAPTFDISKPSTLGASTQGEASPNPFAFGQQSQQPKLGANTQGETASTPTDILFGARPQQTTFGTSTQGETAATPAPAFGLSKQTASTQGETAATPAPIFGNLQQSTLGASKANTPAASDFNFLGAGAKSTSTPEPKKNLFDFTAAAAAAAPSSGSGTPLFASISNANQQPPAAASSSGSGTPLFASVSKPTPQPPTNPFGNNTATPSKSTDAPKFAIGSVAAKADAPTNAAGPGAATNSEPSNGLTKAIDPVTAKPPTPTSTTEAPAKIPKAFVPESWTIPEVENDIRAYILLIAQVNERYRNQIAQLPERADWSALSKWHWQKTSALKKKIDGLKKQAAAAKGITGEETVLSKRKPEVSDRYESPAKKARSDEAPSTPKAKAPALPSTTPKTAPPMKSFNLFGATSTPQTATASEVPATAKAAVARDSETSKAPAAQGGFKPNFGTTTSSNATGFKPNFGNATSSNATGFKPSFGASSTAGNSSSGGFFSQFKADKTKEEMREERRKRHMKNFESPTTSEEESGDYTTKEQWAAQFEKEEAQREADAAAAAASLKFVPTASTTKTDTPTFKFTAASSKTPSTDGNAASQGVASGTSTPGLFGSRLGSPAPSEGARSVFDMPQNELAPSTNIFSKLSAVASSQEQDDSDDDADDEAAPKRSIEKDTKRRELSDAANTGSDSSETLEQSMKRKKPATEKPSLLSRVSRDNSDGEQEASTATPKPSLFDRITRDNSEAPSEASEKEATPFSLNAVNSKLYNVNGSQTPAPKKTNFFDFDAAAAKSAPPKQNLFAPKTDTFAGDQTFKVGSPIKFSTTTSTPFTFTPATPTPAASSATPAKPVNSPFAFLSAAPSAAASAGSSRAVTPASEADASGADSAEINEAEGQNHVEADKSILSNDEIAEFDVLFETENAIARKVVKKEGADPKWENIANGRVFILKNKSDDSIVIRVRMKSGALKVNHRPVPTIQSAVAGQHKTQVRTTAPTTKADGSTGIENVVFAFQAPNLVEKQELATKFSEVYNTNV